MKCCICGKSFKKITNTHLNKRHSISSFLFSKRYPNADRGLTPWNKGKTKHTHPSIKRLAWRLAKQKRWNFSDWQKAYKIKLARNNRSLVKSNNLAELIGIILGDGNLSNFPRTEAVRIICNSKQRNYIIHIAQLIQNIFNKKPTVRKRKNEKAIDIVLYRCGLSSRLGLPCGNKIKNRITIPNWIKSKKTYSISCLKGLFETDGCFCKDPRNRTQIIEIKNNCKNLLQDTYRMLNGLGYHPQIGNNYVRLARKDEVYSFKNLIAFRNY